VINAARLKNLAKQVELPFAIAEGHKSIAGSYEGLALAVVEHPSDHYRGRPTLSWFEDGDTVLLGCECGEWGCWPLTADIKYGEQLVRWSNFRNGHRADWGLSGLGPFEFDRTAYDAAIQQLTR
jgi:hypothetical protein